MTENRDIQSESQFVWKQIKFLVMLPITLVLVLLRKRDSAELMEPLKDLWTFILQPKVTVALVILNMLIFLVEIFLIPADMLNSLVFQPQHLWSFQVIPIISSWFLHASIGHLLGNCLFLYIFGRIVELNLGPAKTLLIYFGSALISTIISGLAGQGGIGASGAIAGLISAAILIDPFYLTYMIIGIPLPVMLVGWAAIIADVSGILFPSPADNIGHFAHMGGYLAITLLVFLMEGKERQRMKKGLVINIIFVLLYLAFVYLGPLKSFLAGLI